MDWVYNNAIQIRDFLYMFFYLYFGGNLCGYLGVFLYFFLLFQEKKKDFYILLLEKWRKRSEFVLFSVDGFIIIIM